MNILEQIRASWGWTGLEPVAIVEENAFGNFIIEDAQGRYWRLCPEDCYCRIVAANRQQLEALSRDRAFVHDWQMLPLVELAQKKFGPLTGSNRYCLKTLGLLGGEYTADNIGLAPIDELIRASAFAAKRLEASSGDAAAGTKATE